MHFESPKDFEPSICSIFQGAEKGAFRQNQVLPMASGEDGIKGFQWKNSGFMTFNFKSDAWSCVLPL